MHVPVTAAREWVRDRLLQEFPRTGATAVTSSNYLDLCSHWEVIVRLLGEQARALGCDPNHSIQPSTFKIVCIAESRSIVGEEYGTGKVILYLLNEDVRHFVPLIQKIGMCS